MASLSYYVFNDTGRISQIIAGGEAEPAPEGQTLLRAVLLAADPADRRMSWDFTNEVWVWAPSGLKDYSVDAYKARLATQLSLDGRSGLFITAQNIALYLTASSEDPAASRVISTDGLTYSTRTNAQIVADYQTYFETLQKGSTVGSLVKADIDSLILLSSADVDTAWISYTSAYVNSRTKAPTLFELAAAIDALPSSFSGAYSDLTGKPSLFSGAYSDLTGKPTLASVATSGAYSDLSGKPSLFSGAYVDLTGRPTLSAVSASGAYSDLTGKPTLATVAGSGAYSDLTGKPALFSGAYTDLSGKPALFSGAYADLTGKPTLTFGKAIVGTTVKADAFPIFKSATVASGVAVFQLTDDGLSTGNALFANEVFADSVQVSVSDATASYQMSWVFSNSNKTLTVTANKLTTSNILTGILGQAQANTAAVKLTVWGR